MADDKTRWRPDEDQRWGREVGRDQEPVTFEVRTRWLYSEERDDAGRAGDQCQCCPGLHSFSRAGHVTSTDVPTSVLSQMDIPGNLWRAIKEFGDDADIIIEVRRKTDG